MIYGYARVSTDGQSVTAQVAALRKHGAGKVFREVASGAKTDRAQLRRLLDQLDAGDVLLVTRLDRLARSTRDLLNILATIAEKVGTPLYVYNAAVIRDRYQALETAFAEVPHKICYAIKANSNLAVLRVLRDLGCDLILRRPHRGPLSASAAVAWLRSA